MKIYTIKIPEYNVKSKPDWDKIGNKLDIILKKHFLNKKIAVRCLSSKKHKKKDINDLIKIIKKLGHDRYNPKREGDRYGNIENKKIDIFCLDWTVKPKSKMMWQMIWSFYKFPIDFGKKPSRIDICIIYDLNKLKRVVHQYKGRKDIKKDAFIFKYPNKKPEAILGIIKIQ
ncbi:MAG: hypothetical protein WC413_02975 [Candidatus Nanoarchaeia archaeon]